MAATANQYQVDGTHYKCEYEHWDLAILLDMGPMEYASSKHVTRWRKKNGTRDLIKALHYLDKLIETYEIYDVHRPWPDEKVQTEVEKFALANGLNALERDYIYLLLTYDSKDDLSETRATLMNILAAAEAELVEKIRGEPTWPGTPEDGGHHGV